MQPLSLEIREETDADIPAIEALTIAAFMNAPHTRHTEHFPRGIISYHASFDAKG